MKGKAFLTVSQPDFSAIQGIKDEGSGRRRVIPPAARRKIALFNGTSGPGGVCHFCKCRFQLAYLKRVRVTSFVVDWGCVDCISDLGLKRSGAIVK